MKKEIRRDSNGRFAKKKTTKEKFDYKGAYQQQQILIQELEMKSNMHEENARLYEIAYNDSVRTHKHSVDKMCNRIERLKTLAALEKDGMRAMYYWNMWLTGRLSWLQRLLWRKELRAMDDEIIEFIDSVKRFEEN